MAKFSLRLVEKKGEFNKKILKVFASKLHSALFDAAIKVDKKVSQIIVNEIYSSPEVYSLLGGGNFPLKGEFGFPHDENARVREIVETWARSITVVRDAVKPRTNTIAGGFKITVDRSYKELLELPSATVVTDEGERLPWLEWLLFFGHKTIIRNYDVVFGSRGAREFSRSGLAIMVAGGKRKWSVPGEFAGTKNNNFITRSLARAQDKIVEAMKQEIKKI